MRAQIPVRIAVKSLFVAGLLGLTSTDNLSGQETNGIPVVRPATVISRDQALMHRREQAPLVPVTQANTVSSNALLAPMVSGQNALILAPLSESPGSLGASQPKGTGQIPAKSVSGRPITASPSAADFVPPPVTGTGAKPLFNGGWSPVQPQETASSPSPDQQSIVAVSEGKAADELRQKNNPGSTPVPPMPISGNRLQASPVSSENRMVSGNRDDGPVMATSSPDELSVGTSYLNSDSACADCGDSGCVGCSRFGIPLPSRPLFPRLAGGVGSDGGRLPVGPLQRVTGRLRGQLAGDTRYGMCGFAPDSSRYLIAEGLYWARNDGQIVGTNFGGVGGDSWDLGWRVTAGQRRDAVSGTEFSYMGLTPLTDTLVSNSPAGQINARFVPAGGFGNLQTNSFFGASTTTQETRTQFHSLEFNRVRHSWDVARTHVGMRYMWFEDDYRLSSRRLDGSNGILSIGGLNQLIGPEAGLDLFYDVGRRVSFSGFGKVGAYLNFHRVDTDLTNNGVRYLDNQNDGTDLAASLELGGNAHLHLTANSRLKFGYTAMWLWGVASAADNYPQFLSPTTGFDPDTSDTVFLHGANFGIEFYR